jgi:trigger factor
MSTKVEKIENNVAKLEISVSKEKFQEALQKSYRKNAGKFNIPGFRKGKAPMAVIEKYYGEGAFYEDAIDFICDETYPEAVKESGISPIDYPHIDIVQIGRDTDFVYTAEVSVKPEVTLGQYRDVEVNKVEYPVADADVDAELASMREKNARIINVEEGTVENGSIAVIDFEGFVDEVPFEGGKGENYELTIGSGTFIPGFEEQLVGAKVGDEKDVKVTFPEEYHSADLAGKEAVFKCKVHEIKEMEKPELNDEFAKDVSEFDTLEELKKDSREKLEKSAASKAEYETKNAVLEKVYNANEIDIPDVMVEEQIDDMMQEFDQQLRYQGMDLQKYFEYLQKDAKDFREELRADAYKKVKTRLIVEAVADAEKLDATDEEVDAELQSMADQYKMELGKLKEAMKAENYALVAQDVKMRKAVDFMFENAIVE